LSYTSNYAFDEARKRWLGGNPIKYLCAMPRPGDPYIDSDSFLRQQGIPPQAAWISNGLLLGAIGYTCLFGSRLIFEKPVNPVYVQELVTSLVLFIAYVVSRRRMRLGGLLGLLVILYELLASFYGARSFVISSTGGFPVLVIASGMLFGSAAAIYMSLACGVGAPLVVYLSGGWSDAAGHLSIPLEQGHPVIIAELITIITCLLTCTVLSSYNKAHASSEKLRRRFMEFFKNIPDGLLALDAQFTIVEANPAAGRILAEGHKPLIGRAIDECLLEAGGRMPISPALQVSSPGHMIPLVLQKENAEERFLELTVRTDPGSHAPTLVVMRDVTQRHQLEERLGHAQRLESVGRLAGGVAHDFNNLLTVVSGNASLLESHPDPEVAMQSKDIIEAAERGAHLTRQLLAFARRDSYLPQALDLGSLVKGMARLLEKLMGEQHRLELSCEERVTVMADATHVEQVMMNLLSNARDAMPGGGKVQVAVCALPKSQASKLGSSLEQTRQAMIEVSDQGQGMSPEIKARIFEPFFTTKPRGRGTGLGLASVHGIVLRSGGCIKVDSVPGTGSVFRIFLPLIQEVTSEALPAKTRRLEEFSGTELILLVEDDDSVRALGMRILGRAGYRVLEAANAEEAMILFREHSDIDFVISDVVMPGAPGPMLIQSLRKIKPGLRAMLISGHHEMDLEAAGMAEFKKGIMTKPFKTEEFLLRVRAELDAR
jgi:PAS domain S-box-containing protein